MSDLITISSALAYLKSENPLSASQTDLIATLATRVRTHDQTPQCLAKSFFEDVSVGGDPINNGVIETPAHIAETMVTLAIETRLGMPLSQIDRAFLLQLRWFDPCVGGGAFPIAILKLYLNTMKEQSVDELPFLAIADLAPGAVLISLCAIKCVLESTDLTLEDYLTSGRLTFSIGDTLSSHGEHRHLLIGQELYDIVIGNPPYVRATRLESSYRTFLKRQFPSAYYGSADLYMYFIASGISCLLKDGVLVFISPASFLRTKSGTSIRSFIQGTCALKALIDLDETQVFDQADVHSTIYAIARASTQAPSIQYAHVKSLTELQALVRGEDSLRPAVAELAIERGWSFHKSADSYSKFKKAYKDCRPMSEFGINIYSGLRPGFSKAFIINERHAATFSTEVRDKWVKCILLPPDIQRWQGAKKMHYIVFTPQGGAPPPRRNT